MLFFDVVRFFGDSFAEVDTAVGNNSSNLFGNVGARLTNTEATSNESATYPGRENRGEMELDWSICPSLNFVSGIN